MWPDKRLATAALLLALGSSFLQAQEFRWGGSLRGYQFGALEDSFPKRRHDTELWLLRLTQQTLLGPHISFEIHGLLTFQSPPLAGAASIASRDFRAFLPLQRDFTGSDRVDLLGSLDRLNVTLQYPSFRLVAGRQAITWGVNYFWPALDLFSPFAPEQVDREYKAGVDALRLTVPLGNFSELEVIGASLGPSLDRDGALGSLLRVHLGSVDVGFMGGRFHRDTVLGSFFTSNLKGTGVRGELAWTRSGDPEDRLRARRTFWRGSLGVDRQLTPTVSWVVEAAWNGYGTSRSSRYLEWIAADRLRRGEVNALGKVYTGTSVSWLAHPLVTVENALLCNWNDPSVLWVPNLSWSTSNNSEVLFGGEFGFGREAGPEQPAGSEYGNIPATLFAAFKVYF